MTNNGKGKGKAVAGKYSAGKRKGNFDDDKTGGLKRKNRGIVQFFEEEAADVNESDDSDFSDFSDGTQLQFLLYFSFVFFICYSR